MKRAASSASKAAPRAKKPRPEIPEYHSTPSLRDESGEIIWPAPKAQIEGARKFILEWSVSSNSASDDAMNATVAAKKKTLIVPDKDADGLTSGAILQKTLVLLGLPEDLIAAHLVRKGSNVHEEAERRAMAAHEPAYIFVLDQGSRKCGPIIDPPAHRDGCRALVLDHHWAGPDGDDFPAGAEHITASRSPPVATSSLLTYHVCAALHEAVPGRCDWLCVMGTHGDLGNTLKWEPPFPDMRATFKAHTKKALNEAVSLLNAPRRTSAYDVPGAWAALVAAAGPRDLLSNPALLAARAEVNGEVARCARAPPRFSGDGRVAVVRIKSAAQVHPVIATRWANTLQSARLEIVLVANEGYLPDRVNFSCRVARSARGPDRQDRPVDIIEVLQEYANRAPDPTLRARLGESFARGHKEASGGIVPNAEFEELMAVLEIGKKSPEGEGSGGSSDSSPKTTRKSAAVAATASATAGVPNQSNTLMNYFGKATASST
ncbi:hypothetical protein SLS62_009912 [Diatrype stigma]|uniref:DHH family protein n=1 Tax=Diatrype stigma TaxID=117547 RepID=A0AAN9YHK1_9PEZI